MASSVAEVLISWLIKTFLKFMKLQEGTETMVKLKGGKVYVSLQIAPVTWDVTKSKEIHR